MTTPGGVDIISINYSLAEDLKLFFNRLIISFKTLSECMDGVPCHNNIQNGGSV